MVASPEEGIKGNCAGLDPDIFHPRFNVAEEQRQAIRAAQAICAECLVAEACLDFANRNGEKQGIWGGQYLGPGPNRSRSSKKDTGEA